LALRKSEVETDFSITFSQQNLKLNIMKNQNQPLEIWKDIPDYEGCYQVSNYGRVKSLSREIFLYRSSFISEEKILKYHVNKGYAQHVLCKKGENKNFKVHQLVAMAFLGHVRCGFELVVDHIDEDKLNNKLSNLQIVTARENVSKSIKNKTSKYTGVHWCNYHKKFIANIVINGKQKNLGSFDNEIDAFSAYEKALSDYNNFNIVPIYNKKTSKYIGVCWIERRKRWCSTIRINGKNKQIGYFKEEDEAHKAYELYKTLNK
jgi:hypothetical protein